MCGPCVGVGSFLANMAFAVFIKFHPDVRPAIFMTIPLGLGAAYFYMRVWRWTYHLVGPQQEWLPVQVGPECMLMLNKSSFCQTGCWRGHGSNGHAYTLERREGWDQGACWLLDHVVCHVHA